jgi:triacylglycerol lipase
MVARLLRWELAALLLAFSLAMYFAGVGLPYLPLAAFAGIFLLYGFVSLATFWISRAYSRLNPLSISQVIRLFFREWFTLFALFAVSQPFPFLFRGVREGTRSIEGGKLILLVHGYKCNGALWFWLKPQLLKHGYDVTAIDLEPPYAGLDHMARQLHRHIEGLLRERSAPRIIVIAHSMGGLAARACVETYGEGPIEKIISIGTPHHGTRLAYLGRGKNARDMEPQSKWLKSLPAQWTRAVPFVSIRSRQDNFISPQESAALPGANNLEVEGLGHLTMVASGEILEVLKEVLADREPENC